MIAKQLFETLWEQYAANNPSVYKIHRLFESRGENIVNDHVAFRTFNDPRVGIDKLSQPFLEAGYTIAGEYHFPEKKLFARHFELQGFPRLFISELLLEEFSDDLQKEVLALINNVPEQHLASTGLIHSGSVFGKFSYQLYERLRNESEYAAWVAVYGYRANHFTISINH
ncbi:MAG: DUF1338 domain-containing protein, partial [Bacteroidales bacterium]